MASSTEAKAGHAAGELQASKARVVFGLLQNADRDPYTHARERKEAPYVTFHVYRDKIVQLCNEDGFAPDAPVSIGENNIGLTSMLRASRKETDFSFRFEHQNNNPTRGIIKSIRRKKLDGALEGVTRTTLLLCNSNNQEEQYEFRSMIRNQFEDIQDTILLFTHNLEKIEIIFHNNRRDGEEIGRKICYLIDRQDTIRVKLTKKTESMGNAATTDETYYHLFKHVVKNLAKNESHKYSADEEASKSYATGEVVLAFPTRLFGGPFLQNQRIFASLPIKGMGFKFLIQADFALQANGQNVDTTSDRNKSLANAVAEAFLQAVEQMCSKRLLYQWMRFLPQRADCPWDPYWSGVIDKIKQKLLFMPVLEPAAPRDVALHLQPMFSMSLSAIDSARTTARLPILKTIMESRQHTTATLDVKGDPLFADIEPHIYLSRIYESEDLDLLREYGLRTINMREIVERATRDLMRPDTRLRSIADDDWQARVARLLHFAWEEDWPEQRIELCRSEMIPLSDGRWSAVANNDIYFPTVQGLNLPLDLDQYPVIKASAVAQADSRKLFESMGILTASTAAVRQAILDKYQADDLSVSAENAARHLHFLYQTANQTECPSVYDKVRILSNDNVLFDPKIEPIYISDAENPYGASLFDRTLSLSIPAAGASRRLIVTMNDAYFKNPPNPPEQLDWSFKRWLYQMFRIRQSLPLTNNKAELSKICRYIAKNRPEKFMGYLQTSWKEQNSQFHDKESIIKQLGEIEVITARSSEHETQLRAFKDTYLPLESLQELCNRFLDKNAYFPFLKLEPVFHNHNRFKQLEAFDAVLELGLAQGPDLLVSFLLDVLACVFTSYPQGLAKDPTDVCCSLYCLLQLKVRESGRKDAIKDRRRRIETQCRQLIFIPQRSDVLKAVWAKLENCIWEGPPNLELRSKYCLKSLYSTHYPKFKSGKVLLADFFLNTLQIEQYWTWQDLVDEIRAFKDCDSIELDRIHSVYKCLHDMKLDGSPKDETKTIFSNEALIYGSTPNGESYWYKTSECLWSSATPMPDKFEVSKSYADLENFFVNELGVQKPTTVRMVYNKLVAHDASQLPIDEIKQTLVQFSSLLEVNGSHDDEGAIDPEPVLANRVFPVKFPSGDVQLRNAQAGKGQALPFAISDRRLLAEGFAGNAAFLDFDMKEMRGLEAFIEWAHLEDSYLSRAVKEATTANVASASTLSSLSRHISAKSGALVRVADHFNAPRARMGLENLYTLLRNSEILETDGITSKLLLAQNDCVLEAENNKAMLHIHLDDKLQQLKVYIPRDKDQQDLSIHSELPRGLCEWLMKNPSSNISPRVPPKAIVVVQSILSARGSSILAILDDNGILENDLPQCSDEAITNAAASEPSPPAASNTSSLNSGHGNSPISEAPENSVHLEVSTASSSAAATLPHRPRWKRLLFRRKQ